MAAGCGSSAVYGYWPALADGNSVVMYDPADHEVEIARFAFPRQRAQNRLCLADYVRPRAEAGSASVTSSPCSSSPLGRVPRS